MDSLDTKVIHSLILLVGIPTSIWLARDIKATRSTLGGYVVVGIVLFVFAVRMRSTYQEAQAISEIFGFLAIFGYCLIFNGIAKRLNDVGSSKWKALWSYIPFVFVVVVPYLLWKPTAIGISHKKPVATQNK